MVVYKFLTSAVTRMASWGRGGSELSDSIRWSVSTRWEGISFNLRFKKKSKKVAKLAVGPEHPETMGRMASGFLCVFHRW